MDALTAWKSKAVSEPITLPSGVVVTLRLPSIKECIIAGEIPLPIWNKLAATDPKANGNGKKAKPPEDLTTEELAHDARFQAEMVRLAVVTVDGKPATLTLEDVRSLPRDDVTEIWNYATRETTTPLAS